MAGLFDSTYGMSPQELEALEKEVRRTRADINPRNLPATTTQPLTGEYLPAEKVSPNGPRPPAGLLGYGEPVATQQQSGVNPNSQPRTFYTNSAGQTGTSIPKGNATSGVYDAVKTAAEKAGWLDGQKNISAADIKSVTGKAVSALGKTAKFAGGAIAPVMMGKEGLDMLNEKYGPAAYDNFHNMMEERRTRQAMEADPALADRGLLTADKVSTQAMDGVRGLMQQGAAQNANAPQQPPQAIPPGVAAPQGQPPQQPPQAPPQQSQAPQGPDPAVAAAQKAQAEQKRQVIERGALQQLQTNELSRTKAAEAVVQADLQRQGIDAPAKERQRLVSQEVSSMRGMSNPEMAKYLSYAMLAVGIGASIADKSGKAFNNFATAGVNSYNAAQNRQLAQAKYAQEYQLKLAEQNRKNRDTDSNIDYRDGTLGVKKDANELDRDKFGYDKEYKNTRLDQYDRGLGQGDVRNGIAQQGVGIAQQRVNIASQGLDLQRQALASKVAKDAATIKNLEKIDVPDVSQKDMITGVDGYLKDQGYKVTPGASSTVADQVIRWRKAYPNVPTRQLIEKATEKVGLKYDDNSFFPNKAGLNFDEEE